MASINWWKLKLSTTRIMNSHNLWALLKRIRYCCLGLFMMASLYCWFYVCRKHCVIRDAIWKRWPSFVTLQSTVKYFHATHHLPVPGCISLRPVVFECNEALWKLWSYPPVSPRLLVSWCINQSSVNIKLTLIGVCSL